jgi:hypothetical protein
MDSKASRGERIQAVAKAAALLVWSVVITCLQLLVHQSRGPR